MTYAKVRAETNPKNVTFDFSLSLLSPHLNAWNLSYGYLQVEHVKSNFTASGQRITNRTQLNLTLCRLTESGKKFIKNDYDGS